MGMWSSVQSRRAGAKTIKLQHARGILAVCQVFVAQHAACPFGAVASVHGWERVGAALTHIARKYLKIAVLRYVDDLFAPERRARYLSLALNIAHCHCFECVSGKKPWNMPCNAWHG